MWTDEGAVARAVERRGDDGRDAREVATRLDDVTAFMRGVLFEIDLEGRYLGVWTGQPELLVRPVDALLGRTVKEVLGPGLGDDFHAAFRRAIETEAPQTIDCHIELPVGIRSFRCEVRMSRRRPTGDAPRTLTLLVRDVTEETELRAKLVEAERLAAMGLVAASVGHEIRQPLAFATTSIELLGREIARSGASSERTAEALEQVRDALRRIGSIAASIGMVATDRRRDTTTDVRRPIEAALDLCASELQSRARVVARIPDLPRVVADEGELCQVLTNLLLNAAHAVDPSRTTSRIGVTADLDESGTKVRIVVDDDGCGIEPANVSRVFDPFFTTKAPGRGTGLGLFVSRRIVEAAGGTLEIRSRPTSGTTVIVSLPIASGQESTWPPQPASSPDRRTVLVVDDEPAFLRSLELVLQDTHDVVVKSRSPEALALVREDPLRFDAILCDLSMPEIDGVAFYGHVEALGRADRFVLMTAGAFTPHGEQFLRQAKCRRIGKPFTLDKLLSVLEAVTAR